MAPQVICKRENRKNSCSFTIRCPSNSPRQGFGFAFDGGNSADSQSVDSPIGADTPQETRLRKNMPNDFKGCNSKAPLSDWRSTTQTKALCASRQGNLAICHWLWLLVQNTVVHLSIHLSVFNLTFYLFPTEASLARCFENSMKFRLFSDFGLTVSGLICYLTADGLCSFVRFSVCPEVFRPTCPSIYPFFTVRLSIRFHASLSFHLFSSKSCYSCYPDNCAFPPTTIWCAWNQNNYCKRMQVADSFTVFSKFYIIVVAVCIF